ncbi:MAG: ArnT family glycosyltransferase [Anaerolineae bacterium]
MRHHLLDRAIFVLAVLLYLSAAVWQLALPGLHYDEAFDVLPAMQLVLGQPVTTFRDNGIRLGGWQLPLMTQDYIGALHTYLALPLFLIFGPSVVSVRLTTIVLGAFTLYLVYRLAGALVTPLAGGIAAWLLALDPSFVFWSRQGVFVTSVTATLGLAAAWAWLRWWRSGSRVCAFAGAFLFGLGLYAKLLFLWMIVGLALAAFVVVLVRFRGRLAETVRYMLQKMTHRAVIAWCVVGFLAGCAPLIAYNVQTGGTITSIMENLTVSYYGTNNLAYLTNLVARSKQMLVVLTGGHLWYLGGSYDNWLAPLALAAGFAGLIWALRRDPQPRYGALAPFIVIVGVLLSSCATVSALWVTHFAVLMPWPALALGGGIGCVLRTARDDEQRDSGAPETAARRRYHLPAFAIGVFALVGVAWVMNAVNDLRYHQALTRSGGLSAHSDAIYDLADWLANSDHEYAAAGRGALPVVAMDWGIAAPVNFLTLGKVRPVEAFGYQWQPDATLTARLERFVRQPDTIYLWRAPDEIIFDRSREFRALYQPLALEEDIVAAFYERSGRPVLGATRLVARGSAQNPPKPLGPR